MKQQRFGIGVELTGIAGKREAEIAAAYFSTQSYYEGTYYDIYVALNPQGREWEFVSDASIKLERREGRNRVATSDSYETEMVSPICRYEDIETMQELVRKLREAGALASSSCGIHVHIDASPFDARTLRNITNIMVVKEDLIYKTLQVSVARRNRWCRPAKERSLEELNQKKPGTLEEMRHIWYNRASRQQDHYGDSRYRYLNLHNVFQRGTIEFRLLSRATHAGKIKTYIQPYLVIGVQALNQTSVSRGKTQTTNEKHTLRTWPLRLGLNGDEFKTAWLHLLRHLDGCITWEGPAQAEVQEERPHMKWEKELQMRKEREVPAAESETIEQEETMHVEAGTRFPAFSVMTGM